MTTQAVVIMQESDNSRIPVKMNQLDQFLQ